MELIAHRGASFDAPENTIAAFRLGFDQGADALELDVHVSSDGTIVVMHDFTTYRISGADKLVRELSVFELKKLDAGSWKGSQFAGEQIPTLEEVLAFLPDNKRVFIEIKCGPEVLPELDRVLKTVPEKAAQIAVIGFGYDTMLKARALFPHLQIYWLFAYKPEHRNNSARINCELIEKCVASGFDGLMLHHSGLFDVSLVRHAHEHGKKVFIWTVDDPVVAQRMIEMGVDGIATNRPGWLREHLHSLQHAH